MSLKDNYLYKFDLGYNKKVIGVDEAGRGPLAGPVVSAVAELKREFLSEEYQEEMELMLEINDSKKLTEKKREKLFSIILKYFNYGIGVSTNHEIDEINILNATFLSMRRAIEDFEKKGINCNNKLFLIDGNHKIKGLNYSQEAIVKGDSKSLVIAAASIIAKVTRDKIMDDLELQYPLYQLKNHKGYGTKKHRELIIKYGITDIHRKTFLKNILLIGNLCTKEKIKDDNKNDKNMKLF